MPETLTVILTADKITPGTVRFIEAVAGDKRPLSIYLPNEVVESLSLPFEVGTEVTLTLAA